MILVRAVAAQSKLHIRLKKHIFVAHRHLLAKDAVVRSRAEREIVAVDRALGGAGDIDFMKLLFESTAVASWELDSSQQNRGDRKVRFVLDRDRIFALKFKAPPSGRSVMKKHRLQQKRNITQATNRTAIDLKTLGPFELAINQRDIDL